MPRALLLASLLLASASALSSQALNVLHIKVVVIDSEGRAMPVARHVFLLSDDPPTAAPRAIVTSRDGTADVRLRPGTYTVDSERPVAFEGRVYQWSKRLDIVAGRDAVIEFTAENADPAPIASETTTVVSTLETDPSFLLSQWQASVVALWTPTTRASGFVVDARGLVATNQRGLGTATVVEVQLTPTVKVAARVLATDPVRDVAVLWISPTVAASVKPVSLGCSQATRPSLVEGQAVFTIGAPLREQKGMTSGTVGRVEPRSIDSDLRLPSGSAGGPVFTADGAVVGITSVATDDDDPRRETSRVVRIADVCEVVASAEQRMQGVPPPNGTLLPVEPVRPFPMNVPAEAGQRRAANLSPPQMSSSDFDITFITPVLLQDARSQAEPRQERGRNGAPAGSSASETLRPLIEFGNWSEYVADLPPVLMIRVRPKLVERFWTTVARGAARTQGVSLPPIKRLKAGFSRMRVSCGNAEVTPIHPFMLEQRTSETHTLYEGLYVFDPDALGPHCGTVELVLYSEEAPDKGDTRLVDPAVLERIWQDFAPYRAISP
jgi:S1-C subfamily serine protease